MGLDYYGILNVLRSATVYDIKLAYRKLALRLHPQRKNYPQHPNPRPEGTFDLPLPSLPEHTYWEVLNEAYDVLSNSLRREIYDQYGEEGLKCGISAPHGHITPYCYHGEPMRTYFEFFGSYSPFCDLIDAVTNPPTVYNTKEGVGVKNKDPSIERLIQLELEEVFHGGVKVVKILRHEFVDGFKQKTEVKEVSLSVPIAPGIMEGTRLVFPEAGDQGPTKIPADIVFVVCDKPHKTFRREKWNLHMNQTISLKEALTGFKLSICTIDDRKLEILVTDVVDCNYETRISSEGLPCPYNNQQKGELIVHYQIQYPQYINKESREKLVKVFEEVESYSNSKNKTFICQCRKGSNSSLTSQTSSQCQ